MRSSKRTVKCHYQETFTNTSFTLGNRLAISEEFSKKIYIRTVWIQDIGRSLTSCLQVVYTKLIQALGWRHFNKIASQIQGRTELFNFSKSRFILKKMSIHIRTCKFGALNTCSVRFMYKIYQITSSIFRTYITIHGNTDYLGNMIMKWYLEN